MERQAFVIAFGIVSFATGAAITVAYHLTARFFARRRLEGKSRHGLTYSIGSVPHSLREPDRLRGAKVDWRTATLNPRLRAWYERASEQHPNVARAFDAVLEIHMAKQDWPAGKTALGHGGRTLLDHAFRVAERLLEVAETFEYKGGQRDDGTIFVEPLDPSYVFDREDPLLGLIGFCHDMGKLETMDPDSFGNMIEVRTDHDHVGSLMLARVGEVFDLGWKERRVLLAAVNYYHHPYQMPVSISDRTRSLTQILRLVDIEASRWEFENPIDLEGARRPQEPGASAITAFDRKAVSKICDILTLPSKVNGPKDESLGYKFQEFVYLRQDAFGAMLAREFGNEALDSSTNHPRSYLLEQVLASLKRLGILKCDWGEAELLSNKAFFDVEWYDHRSYDPASPKYGSGALDVWRSAIILKGEALSPALRRLPDCRLIPLIKRPTLGIVRGTTVDLPAALQDGEGPETHEIPEAPKEDLPIGRPTNAAPEPPASEPDSSIADLPHKPAQNFGLSQGDATAFSETLQNLDPPPSAQIEIATPSPTSRTPPKRSRRTNKGPATAQRNYPRDAVVYLHENGIQQIPVTDPSGQRFICALITDKMIEDIPEILATAREGGPDSMVRVINHPQGEFLAILTGQSSPQPHLNLGEPTVA